MDNKKKEILQEYSFKKRLINLGCIVLMVAFINEGFP